MIQSVDQLIDTPGLIEKHGQEFLFVHRFVQSFQHAADLGRSRSIRVNPRTFKHSFQASFQHVEKPECDFVMRDV